MFLVKLPMNLKLEVLNGLVNVKVLWLIRHVSHCVFEVHVGIYVLAGGSDSFE